MDFETLVQARFLASDSPDFEHRDQRLILPCLHVCAKQGLILG
jgi:hypothetical protein